MADDVATYREMMLVSAGVLAERQKYEASGLMNHAASLFDQGEWEACRALLHSAKQSMGEAMAAEMEYRLTRYFIAIEFMKVRPARTR